MIFRLKNETPGFPDPHLAEEDGLLAVGGDFTPEWLLTAYCYGIFPWCEFRGKDIWWYCPHQRFVIFPDEIHISHSMRTLINSHKYRVTYNRAFDEVIEGCSKAQNRYNQRGAWLGGRIIPAYKKLHEMGYAASIEVWEGDALVGGLYGVIIGKNFFGESMFSLAPSASKLALIYLAKLVGSIGGIIDCQLETAHLKSMGGRFIPYDDYMKLIEIKEEGKEK